MKPGTKIKIAYRKWCKETFPDYKVQDFPCHGRMYQVWEASWLASKVSALEKYKDGDE